MAQKITLIEYDEDTYAGDDMDPDIQHRDFVPCVSGTKIVPAEPPADIEETARRIEDMRNYAYEISSSSSSCSSFSSEAPVEELFEHHETGGDDSYTIGQTSYSEILAQTFTPDIAHRISRVELELFDNQGDGITGTITVDVKATSGGLPTGAALASGTIDAADLNPAHYSDIYNDVSIDLQMAVNAAQGCFSPDGLFFFVVDGRVKPDAQLWKFALSVAWDISTLTPVTSVNLLSDLGMYLGDYHNGVFFSANGLKVYISGRTNPGVAWVSEITLSSAWDITSRVSTVNKDISATVTYGNALFFSPDGTKMFVADYLSEIIFQYTLTAWDISTATYASKFTDVSASGACGGIYFTSDGKKMMVMIGATKTILFYSCSTAWDLGTESKDSYEMDVSGDITEWVRGVYCKPDGKTLFVNGTDGSSGDLYEFKLPALRGDWHEADMGEGFELDAATKYVIEATYDSYEVGVSEPEWVNNADGDDNYEAGTLLRHDGSNWYDS